MDCGWTQLRADGKELPVSSEKWTRLPFTRKQFNELFVIKPDMSKEEIARRVRAISYQHWQPYVEIEGFGLEYKPKASQSTIINEDRINLWLPKFLNDLHD